MNPRNTIIALLLCCCPICASAQTGGDNYRDIYNEAEQKYNIGQLEQAEELLQHHIKTLPIEMRQSAYRLLALCYLGMDRDTEAQDYVRLLLDNNPYYSTTLDDPQRFIDMVEDIKAGNTATITTASSQAETLQEVPVPTTLITEEMIRVSGARNLQEVLAIYVPGMIPIDCNDDINISMRGIYSNSQEKILFMLNGHRLNSYCTNTAAPDFSISLEKLKQIEVLRGPASSLYGGVSLTAVVNLITKQGAEVDGLKVRAGIGNYGQYRGDAIFGKRYFDLDLLVWGSFHMAKGEQRFVGKEDTGLKLYEGDVTIGRIGNKPNYDIGASIKYKKLQFLYNGQFSQIQAPMTMTHTFSPYDADKYKTFNGLRPSHTSFSHHAHVSLGQQFGDFYLKGDFAYDNNDLTHYQVITEAPLPGLSTILPLPEHSKSLLENHTGGFARYISGQEHTFSTKLQGDWSYINNGTHKGLLTFGAEYSYFQLDDARYAFTYDFQNTLPETANISEVGKGHENNANVYAQLKHQWGPFILNAGLRFDYKARYDTTYIREFSPRVALIFVQPKWTVKLSYSKAFTDAPYLYRKTNQFLLAMLGVTGREQQLLGLSPETMHSWQLTLAGTQLVKGLNLELNAFYNQMRDMIYMSVLEHYNMGNSNIYGIEFAGSYDHRNFYAHLSASWMKATRYEMDSVSYDRAFNMPRFSANAVLAWKPTSRLQLHTRLAFYAKQRTNYINIINYGTMENANNMINELETKLKEKGELTREEQITYAKLQEVIHDASQELLVSKEVPPYFIWDLGARYQIGKLELSFNVNNLLNRQYSISGACTGLIPQRGRWFLFDVAYKF